MQLKFLKQGEEWGTTTTTKCDPNGLKFFKGYTLQKE